MENIDFKNFTNEQLFSYFIQLNIIEQKKLFVMLLNVTHPQHIEHYSIFFEWIPIDERYRIIESLIHDKNYFLDDDDLYIEFTMDGELEEEVEDEIEDE